MDIYTELKKDHEELKELLEQLIALDKEDDYREVLVQEIEQALVPHSRAEESVFYNSIRALNPDNSELIDSLKEHLEAETLLKTLKVKKTANIDWKPTAIKIKDALEHHIQNEESRIFSVARKIFSEEDAKMLGTAFVEMKSKVSSEGMQKSTFDFVVNLMPPRFVDKIKALNPISRPE